jgi:thymidylate synthase (FAD)
MVRKEISSPYLDMKIPVLGKGFVELCDYLGNDESVVRCARQSYGKDKDTLSIETVNRQIKDMIINGHTSPFEQVVFQFHLKMPIFVQRQFIRHRTARVNEISGRYTMFDKDNFYVPGENILVNRKSYPGYRDPIDQDPKERRDTTEETHMVQLYTEKHNNTTYDEYNHLINNDIPFEVARINLPLTLFTEFYWQMDLHNLLHFLELRMGEHAQKEIREYAIIIYKIVKDVCPITIKYFTEYRLNTLTLGQDEIKALVGVFGNEKDGLEALPASTCEDLIDKMRRINARNKARIDYLEK